MNTVELKSLKDVASAFAGVVVLEVVNEDGAAFAVCVAAGTWSVRGRGFHEFGECASTQDGLEQAAEAIERAP